MTVSHLLSFNRKQKNKAIKGIDRIYKSQISSNLLLDEDLLTKT